MKILKLISATMFGAFITVNTAFAENASGGWTNVVSVHTYMVTGSFCGPDFVGVTLVQLETDSSPYGGDCRSDYAFINGEAAGSEKAIATVFLSQATGREIKINVDTDNLLYCQNNGVAICAATQVSIR